MSAIARQAGSAGSWRDHDGPIATVPSMPATELFDLLSDRELEIAQCIMKGMSNKEIGKHLGISPWTVSAHLRSIFKKLGTGHRVELCYLLTSQALRS
ncbi:DNA-binding CsgD family transcriptional regulator [Novosphingobium chloroacetimidivorans]|uniref:DNA-binding CsgD family transcriptional regulator n=1 Tax=Novosphingobium chloroacetimidivorans TaxID=1428314 RepID=A0A7W7NXV5_9SPHN|nr:helix-turn-helix transcriptional regulator [Novosphingobium chloroacetimidivorans]MBB4861068.1 DNA-binding CsgD family transcriptional regulator [Novosphingobium chloroacetimidivorans]